MWKVLCNACRTGVTGGAMVETVFAVVFPKVEVAAEESGWLMVDNPDAVVPPALTKCEEG